MKFVRFRCKQSVCEACSISQTATRHCGRFKIQDDDRTIFELVLHIRQFPFAIENIFSWIGTIVANVPASIKAEKMWWDDFRSTVLIQWTLWIQMNISYRSSTAKPKFVAFKHNEKLHIEVASNTQEASIIRLWLFAQFTWIVCLRRETQQNEIENFEKNLHKTLEIHITWCK